MQSPDSDLSAAVPLDLLDDLLRAVAGAIHDRPVQSAVAARLLLETALHGVGADEDGLVDRGLGAITSAADQARDVMWALSAVAVRPGHIATDVAEVVGRVNAPTDPALVSVDVDPATDIGRVEVLVHAVREVLADVLLDGERLHQLSVSGDAEALHARVSSGLVSDTDASPWLRLARARVRPLGGDLRTTPDGTLRHVDLWVRLEP